MGQGLGDTATVLFAGEMSASRLGAARRLLSGWATAQGLDADTVHAIVLSGYEALANTVEHAYRQEGAGAVEVHVGREGDVVTLVVCDQGRWRPPATDPNPRGRGLVLIRRLSTDATVARSPTGTIVTMTWRVPA